ncbi:MAG: class I SAM-dependent methyltransferase [Thermodesulfobacteriota bacterium]|nr:class I SAM-dependent methyltransferase [Thermodesulfobacteriota bacterium]
MDWIYDGMTTQSALKGRINRGWRELFMVINFVSLQSLNINTCKILVFGCGTGLSFNLMLQNKLRAWGTDYVLFDFANTDYPQPMYMPSLAPLMRKRFIPLEDLHKDGFDIIAMTEIFEHFTNPVEELGNVVKSLLPDGFIIGTTGLVDKSGDDFSEWWYKGAQTHVSFLSRKSFQLMAAKFGCLGLLFPPSPLLIGEAGMSDSQCVFVLHKV